jgi:hypothetical protein
VGSASVSAPALLKVDPEAISSEDRKNLMFDDL